MNGNPSNRWRRAKKTPNRHPETSGHAIRVPRFQSASQCRPLALDEHIHSSFWLCWVLPMSRSPRIAPRSPGLGDGLRQYLPGEGWSKRSRGKGCPRPRFGCNMPVIQRAGICFFVRTDPKKGRTHVWTHNCRGAVCSRFPVGSGFRGSVQWPLAPHFQNHQQSLTMENMLKREQLARAGATLADLLNTIWP